MYMQTSEKCLRPIRIVYHEERSQDGAPYSFDGDADEDHEVSVEINSEAQTLNATEIKNFPTIRKVKRVKVRCCKKLVDIRNTVTRQGICKKNTESCEGIWRVLRKHVNPSSAKYRYNYHYFPESIFIYLLNPHCWGKFK